MSGDPAAWPQHTCNSAWLGVIPPPPCAACQMTACAPSQTYVTTYPASTATASWAVSPRISDADVERIAKRVVELMKQP